MRRHREGDREGVQRQRSLFDVTQPDMADLPCQLQDVLDHGISRQKQRTSLANWQGFEGSIPQARELYIKADISRWQATPERELNRFYNEIQWRQAWGSWRRLYFYVIR